MSVAGQLTRLAGAIGVDIKSVEKMSSVN